MIRNQNNIDANIIKNNINNKSAINSKNNNNKNINLINYRANQIDYNNNYMNKMDYNNFSLINNNNNNVNNPFMSNINNNNDIHRYNNNICNNFNNNNQNNNMNNSNNLVNNNNMNNNFNMMNMNNNMVNTNNFNNNNMLTQRNNTGNYMSNSMNSINISKGDNKCDNNLAFNKVPTLSSRITNISNNQNNAFGTNINSINNNNNYNLMNNQKINFNCNSEIKNNRIKNGLPNNNYNQGNNYENNKQNNFNNCFNIIQINNNSNQNNNNMNFINMLSNNSNEKTKTSSFSNFNLLKVGIKDLENNSYANSVLFLLLNIPSLTKFFLNKELHVAFDEKDFQLSSEFEQLFLYFYTNLEQNFKKPFEPKNFLEILKLNNVEPNPDKAVIFFLDTLHKELNTLKDNTNIILNPNINDKESVKKCEIENFVNFNNSIISNQLNLFEIVESQCNKCNSKMYNFLTNNNFKLDILGVYKNKKRRRITVKDCLQYQTLINKDTKFCNNCKMLNPMKKISNLFSTSNLLLFILDRGNSGNFDYIPFDLEEKIDCSNFIENQQSPSKYELFGVISATIKIDVYKYVCFCKSQIDKKWYYYDNEIIEETQIDLLINLNDGSQYIPLILLYKSF
jgi:hypothetical protein